MKQLLVILLITLSSCAIQPSQQVQPQQVVSNSINTQESSFTKCNDALILVTAHLMTMEPIADKCLKNDLKQCIVFVMIMQRQDLGDALSTSQICIKERRVTNAVVLLKFNEIAPRMIDKMNTIHAKINKNK